MCSPNLASCQHAADHLPPCNPTEIMDHGYPQILSAESLKLYITQEGVHSELEPTDLRVRPPHVPFLRVPFLTHTQRRALESRNTTMQVTGAVSWRREGLQYKKNEVYLDIVETVNVLMTAKGTVLRSDVTGRVLMKCYLSVRSVCKAVAMPPLRSPVSHTGHAGAEDRPERPPDRRGLGGRPAQLVPVSDRRRQHLLLRVRPSSADASRLPRAHLSTYRKSIELDDVTFHQCVDLTRFAGEKTITFVPPDGAFELMKYRVTDNVTLPFKILPLVKEVGRSRIEVTVKLRASGFTSALNATAVVVRIPVPNHTAGATITVTGGKAKYKADVSCLVWKVARLSGQDEVQLSAEVELVRWHRALCCHPRADSLPVPPGEHACGPQGVEQAAHHHELPGAHVHQQRPQGPLPEGVGEERLPDGQVGALPHPRRRRGGRPRGVRGPHHRRQLAAHLPTGPLFSPHTSLYSCALYAVSHARPSRLTEDLPTCCPFLKSQRRCTAQSAPPHAAQTAMFMVPCAGDARGAHSCCRAARAGHPGVPGVHSRAWRHAALPGDGGVHRARPQASQSRLAGVRSQPCWRGTGG